jgi:crossover junction endodeoxyribonuclease RuvC
MIILGIDPGTATTGFGLIEKEKSKLKLLNYGCIKTSANLNTAERLERVNPVN